MKVLFDTNVVLDILLKRPGFSEAALTLARTKVPWLSTLSLANIAYIIGRSRSDRIQGPVEFLRTKFHLCPLTSETVARALELNFADFEDGLQVASAESEGVPFLVTRNIRDFAATERVTILSLAELAARLEE